MKILVTGGTGLVGAALVQRLLDSGQTVRLLSRNASSDCSQFDGNVEPIDGSVADIEDVQGAAEACDVVVHNAGVVAETPPDVTFQMVNVGGTANMLHEAQRDAVKRFIYVSSLGADRGNSDYHRSKIQAENLVKSFPNEWVITRPAVVYGPGDEVVSLLMKMVRTLPAIPVIAGGNQLSQPIWHEDLADALLQCVTRDDVLRQTWLLAGDEKISMNEMLDRLSTIIGKSPVRVPMPGWLAEQGAQVLATLGVDLPFSVDQITMLQEGNMIYTGQVNALTEVFNIRPVPLNQRLAQLANEIPVSSAKDGVGDLQARTFRREIGHPVFNARQLFAAFKQDFTRYFEGTGVTTNPEPLATQPFELGATLTLALPLRGNVQVRVAEDEDTAATLLTVQGHPLAGAVRFTAEDLPAGGVAFSVETYDRPANLADAATMATVGRMAQGITWETVLDRVVQTSGGIATETVRLDRALPKDDARPVEQWLKELEVQSRKGAKLI